MKGFTLGSAALLLIGCANVGAVGSSAVTSARTAPCDLPTFTAAVLQRLNAARAAGADCGATGRFAPAAALRWNTQLTTAAELHAQDMAWAGDLPPRLHARP